MNQTNAKNQKSFLPQIIAIVLVVGAIGYYFYSSSNSNNSSNSSFTVSTATSSVGAYVLGLLSQISSLQINTALFQSPVYQSLTDFTVQVPPEPIGKANPFQTGGVTVTNSSASTNTSVPAGQ